MDDYEKGISFNALKDKKTVKDIILMQDDYFNKLNQTMRGKRKWKERKMSLMI